MPQSLWQLFGLIRLEPAEGAAQFGGAVGFVAAAVGEDDFFGLPGKHLRQALAGGGAVAEGGAPVGRNFAVRFGNAYPFHYLRPETAGEFGGLEVFYKVGEDQGTAGVVEENSFGHSRTAEERELGDVVCPLGRGTGIQIGIE